MVQSTHYQRQSRLSSTFTGRVSKRPRGPVQRLTIKKSEVTQDLLADKHPALLDDLQLAPCTLRTAADKFKAFVELEKLADQLDSPLVNRLIASEARFHNGYQILEARKNPEQKGKNVVTAIVKLIVGADANFDLVKEREGVILAKGPTVDEEKPEFINYAVLPMEVCQESLTPEASKKTKPSLGRRIYGNIVSRESSVITVRVSCSVNALEVFQELTFKLYADINTVAQKTQLDAIAHVCNKGFIQKKLGFEISPNAPPAVEAPAPVRGRSRSPSIIWLDDEVDAKKSSFASSSDSVICLDDLPEEPTTSTSEATTPSASHADLNEKQQLAIDEINRRDTDSIFMLFGPPGTGKTTTLIKAIVKLVQNGSRILICAPSNKAADHIACGILKEGLCKNPKYGLHRHVSRSLNPSSVPSQLRSHAGIVWNGRELVYAAEEIDLDDYAIVVSTLGSAPSLREPFEGSAKKFSHIVVDEAGQAAEMEIWQPLAFFASSQTRLIVAGDPMQLGPVASVHLLDDPAYGYKTSILSRLYQNEAFRNDSRNMVQLTKNYRSHEAIVNVVSNVFYNDTLEFTRPAGHNSLDDWHRLPKHKFPVFFENIYGRVQTDRNGSSSNEAEANAVVFYIESLLRSRRVKPHEIGVVSPYTAQTELIRRLLGPLSEVTVDTVEKFQGSERRVIIMTAVRNGLALGFMEDRQRLNTALSRAQQLLIVIGHGRSLEASPDWFKFIDYCKTNNAYVDADYDSRMY